MTTNRKLKFIIDALFLALILAMAYVVLRYLLPLLMPFVLAFIIAYLLRKPIRFLSKALHLWPWLAAVLLVALFYGVVGLGITFFGVRIVASVTSLVQRIPSLYTVYLLPAVNQVIAWLEEILSGVDPLVLSALEELQNQLIQLLGQLVSSLSVWLTALVSGMAASLPGALIRVLFMVISTFFIAIDYEKIVGFFLRLFRGRTRVVLLQIKTYVVGTLLVCIRSYLLIMCITFAELAVGLRIIGVERSTLVAFLIAVFDILPVLGTGGIMVPWVVLSALSGDMPRAAALLVLYLIITVIRNIIEPKIVGQQIGLHPVLTLMSMFVGTHFFGVVGLFGLPILLSLLRYLNETGAISLYPVVEQDTKNHAPSPANSDAAGDS